MRFRGVCVCVGGGHKGLTGSEASHHTEGEGGRLTAKVGRIRTVELGPYPN